MSESGICKIISEHCEKSSQTQRIMFISLVASLSLIIILLGILVHHDALLIDGCHDVMCVHEASKIIKLINAEEEPCTNFHKFVCNNLNKQEIEDRKISELNSILLEDDQSDNVALQLSKRLYRSCLTETDAGYIDVLKEKIQLLDGWPILGQESVDWLQVVRKINVLGVPMTIFLALTIDIDLYNRTLLKIDVPPLDDAATFISNTDRWERIATKLGADEAVIKEALSSISTFLTTNKNEESHFELITPSDLQLQCKDFNWIQFFTAFLGDDNQISPNTQILADTAQINKRLNLLSSTPKDTFTNYMIWKVIDKLNFFLLKDRHQASRRYFCMKTLTDTFSLNPIDVELSKKYLPNGKVDAIITLVKNVANAYAKTVATNTKMYTNAEYFTDVMANVKVVVGSNKNDFDDLKITLHPDLTFLELVLLGHRLQSLWLFSKFDGSDLMPWHINNSFFTPRYYKKYNTIYIPSAIVGELRPNYANYGSLGTLIAQEFTNLLKKEIVRNRTTCSYDQEQVLAHVVPVQVSRKAYAAWVSAHKRERRLINLVYEPEQLFWISASETICETSLHIPLTDIPEFTNDFRCMKTNSNCKLL